MGNEDRAQSRRESLTRLQIDRFDFSRIQIFHSPDNFSVPRGLNGFVFCFVQALDQRACEFRTFCNGEIERHLQQFRYLSTHTPNYISKTNEKPGKDALVENHHPCTRTTGFRAVWAESVAASSLYSIDNK